jgi:hypothetical protein
LGKAFWKLKLERNLAKLTVTSPAYHKSKPTGFSSENFVTLRKE